MGVRRTAAVLTAASFVLALGAPGAVADTGHDPAAAPPDRVDGGDPRAERDTKARKRRGAVRRTRKGRRVIARAARTDSRSKPVLFVHGLDAFGDAGVDCSGTWSDMVDRLRGWGYTGTLATVEYYWADSNCSTSLDGYGSHSAHYPRTDAHQSGSHDMDGDIRHLGYHLAWMIYTQYSSKGVTVDVVGHSMGGLITRYALWGIQTNQPDFPPYLYVEDVVTLGTPHSGSGYASWCGWSYECTQMSTGSSFMSWLASNAPNPQGDGGTDWTAMGSYDDGYVSETSATAMSAAHKVRYFNMGIGHSDYQHATSDVRDADTEYNDYGGPWYAWYSSPYPVRWSDYALLYGSW